VLLHPSLHDSGGTVCLEAMAAGRPMVCLDLGGPAVHVDENSGFAIPAKSPEQVVDGIAEALHSLATDVDLRKRMSAASRQRVRDVFTEDSKAERTNALYKEIGVVGEAKG